jgi:8-oxo-dGTP diphosphatase
VGRGYLVSSAAVRLQSRLTEISAADFAEVLRINLVGAFVLTKLVTEPMRERGGGSIIHIGSALGSAAAPFFSPYVASKGGLNALARAAAVELVGDGIRVNVVAPGTIDTVINAGVSEFRRNMLAHRIPIGRAGHVDDIASACLYLASDASRYVTGSTLAVDGGGPLHERAPPVSEPLTLPSPQRGEGAIEVVAAVIERGGRILIARRHAGSHLGGLWEFPGGKRQDGETAEAALVREIREELDAAVSVGELLDDVEWRYPEKTVRLRFFRCALEGEPRAAEGQEIAWVAPTDLGGYEFPPADLSLVARLRCR